MVDEAKAPAVTELLEYATQLFPNIPLLKQSLTVGFQLSEQIRNKAGVLSIWANSLPIDNLALPLYWSNPKATTSKHFADRLYEEIENCRSVYAKLTETEPRLKTRMSLEEFTWTIAMFHSRSVQVGGVHSIVPVLDMLNHSSRPNCQVQFNDFHYELRSLQQIQPDQQLLIDYGPYDDYDYLLKWGFVPDENPSRCAVASTGLLSDLSLVDLSDRLPIDDLYNPTRLSLKEVKHRLLAKLGGPLLSEVKFTSHPPSPHETVLRVLLFTLQDAVTAGFTSVDALLSFDFSKPLTKRLERKVSEFLAKVCEESLYTSSLELDGDDPQGRALEAVERQVWQHNRDFYLRRLVSS
jgi:hypothetical protein